MYDAIADYGVTHMCGAPIVMGMLVNAPSDSRREIPRGVQMMTAGAAPPAAIIEKMQAIGFDVTHVYGLTEVYGPVTVCAWQEAWSDLPPAEQAVYKARQGVPYVTLEGVMVGDPLTVLPVPSDGKTMGEIFMRGNTVMRGYLKNPRATQDAFAEGWFHTGDLGVMHPDGYIEVKDRLKDIIISGGENISTIEVEGVLYRHPSVLEAGVVARPDAKWGETVCAFITLKEGETTSAEDIIAFCRDNMAHFKVPQTVVFGPLPKTSTGKLQKYKLREGAKVIAASGATEQGD
jgi:fatty-acyl-CoA synthase